MKYLISGMLLLVSTTCFTNVDAYKWCQIHLDELKVLTEYSNDQLVNYRKQVSNATTIKSLSSVLGFPLDEIVTAAMNHQSITKEEAEKVTIDLMKKMKIDAINTAIKMKPYANEQTWTIWYEGCIKSNAQDM